MKYIFSKNMNNYDFVKEVVRLDHLAYPKSYWDTAKNFLARLKIYNNEYVLCFDKNKLIGYVSFVPIKNSFYKRILTSNQIIDDGKAKPSNEDRNSKKFLLLSIVVDKKYRKKGIAKRLIALWFKNNNYESIVCYAISPYSFHLLLKEFKFKYVKHIELGTEVLKKGHL